MQPYIETPEERFKRLKPIKEETLEERKKRLMREYMRAWRRKRKDHLKEYQSEYQREWRKRNKDKVREYQNRFWSKKAEQEG